MSISITTSHVVLFTTFITRSPNVLHCDNQMRAAVLRSHFSSPALIPAVDYKLYPILCQLTFVPYTLHLWVLTCDQEYTTMYWSQTSGSTPGSFLFHDAGFFGMGNNFSPFFKEGHSLLSVACLDNLLVLFQCFD